MLLVAAADTEIVAAVAAADTVVVAVVGEQRLARPIAAAVILRLLSLCWRHAENHSRIIRCCSCVCIAGTDAGAIGDDPQPPATPCRLCSQQTSANCSAAAASAHDHAPMPQCPQQQQQQRRVAAETAAADCAMTALSWGLVQFATRRPRLRRRRQRPDALCGRGVARSEAD